MTRGMGYGGTLVKRHRVAAVSVIVALLLCTSWSAVEATKKKNYREEEFGPGEWEGQGMGPQGGWQGMGPQGGWQGMGPQGGGQGMGPQGGGQGMVGPQGGGQAEQYGPQAWGGARGQQKGQFMLGRPEVMVQTEAGSIRVVLGGRPQGSVQQREAEKYGEVVPPGALHIAYIDLQPNALMLPQYLDAELIMFVRRAGEVRLGRIYKGNMVEKDLKAGDIYRIPAGVAFYLANTGKGQTVQIIAAIDASESLGPSPFQSFFIGGGTYPPSVLAGFDMHTLAMAFNVTPAEVSTILGRQMGGPIIYMAGDASHPTKRVADAMRVGAAAMQNQLGRSFSVDTEEVVETASGSTAVGALTSWWRWLTHAVVGRQEEAEQMQPAENKDTGPDSYNLYDRKPDFQNRYGWTAALDGDDFEPLKRSGLGVYLVNLTAGSMLAPHVNPVATEYGVVLAGQGSIQVVLPNGTSAMNVQVSAGDAFWVPRFFPFCQVASRDGPLEFFGFATSARRNQPQFLAGANSVVRGMAGPELAAAFGVSEEEIRDIVESQVESVILPSWPPAGGAGAGEGKGKSRGKEGGRGRRGEEREGEERGGRKKEWKAGDERGRGGAGRGGDERGAAGGRGWEGGGGRGDRGEEWGGWEKGEGGEPGGPGYPSRRVES